MKNTIVNPCLATILAPKGFGVFPNRFSKYMLIRSEAGSPRPLRRQYSKQIETLIRKGIAPLSEIVAYGPIITDVPEI